MNASCRGPADLSSRRRFLAGSSLALAGAAGFRGRAAAAVAATETIGVAAIGVGNRASLLLDQLPPGSRIVALADCNLPRAEQYKATRGGSWDVCADYRRVLDRPDVDAVIVGTGEFQRVLPCIHACQACKDVYAEKPLTLYVREGRTLVDAVRRHGRVLQVGTQQRSMAINRLACAFIRSGGLGRLLEVRAVNYGPADPSPVPYPAGEPVPEGLDWNAWLNQAADRPYHPSWMNWMAWCDFAGGQITNWAPTGSTSSSGRSAPTPRAPSRWPRSRMRRPARSRCGMPTAWR